jgi:dipeptidyl aminopeptidase/acylaminoacyl peptidase
MTKSRLPAMAAMGAAVIIAVNCRGNPAAAPTNSTPEWTKAPLPATAQLATEPGENPTPVPILPTTTLAATDAATPEPTEPPAARQLTSGGCCVQPGWSPDGRQVWYIDRPSPAEPAGIWAVDAETGGEPIFITDRLGIRSPDGTLRAYPERGQTWIERADGVRWVAPSGGRPVSFSPDGRSIAWQQATSASNFDRRVVSIWTANVDGTDARLAAEVVGGGLGGWFPDGQRLLVSGREPTDGSHWVAALDLDNGSLALIISRPGLRGFSLSPGGGWLAYQVAFTGAADNDGLWLVRTDGSGAYRLEVYGAYRWRSEGRLLVVPLEPGQGSQRFVEVEAAAGRMRSLTDATVTPVRIADGDWALSPDGRLVAYVSADDRNIWLLDLRD